MKTSAAALSRGPFTGSGFTEAGTLHGFVTNTRGPFFPFFFDDVTDNRIDHTYCSQGPGDGVTTDFQLYRTVVNLLSPLNSLIEPVTAPRVVDAIYLDGIVVPNNTWSVDKGTGIVSFAHPPGSGAMISADFSYWFRCRFTTDVTDFEEFMYLLTTTGVKFVSAIGDKTQAPS